MPTQILATGDTAANSADVVVTDPITVALKDAAYGAEVLIRIKDDVGSYSIVGVLNNWSRPAVVIAGPGTYRFSRKAGSTCGVFSG